ncbi:MAG: hypothetical protein K6C68_01740 [Ruminococcus sp.]|nr:hypothetical protein [Ruminococcus sp.]
MKKIIIFCIIAIIVCTGVWFFRSKTLLRTSSGWELYNTNCRELLDDDARTVRIYSSFGLNRMKKLKTLEVDSIDKFDFLKELDELQDLNVNVDESCPLNISSFPEVGSLKKLIIHNGDYTEICLDEISDRMPELECIWLFGGHITDDNIRDISKCRKIKSILFWGIERKPFDLSPLTKLDSLEELNLEPLFPQIDLTPIVDMSGLKKLECTVYNEEELEITSHFSSVQELIIYNYSGENKLKLPDDYFDEMNSLERAEFHDFIIGDNIDISSLPTNLKEMTFIDCNISENIKDKISESDIDIEVKNNSNN